MRILFTIPHYYKVTNEAIHGSTREKAQIRSQALTQCIVAIHQLFGKDQIMYDYVSNKVSSPPAQKDLTPNSTFIDAKDISLLATNTWQSYEIDVVVCTSGENHLLDRLQLSPHLYLQYETQAEPTLLGFECHSIMQECLGMYDYYCYMEDDLILHDPCFFQKLKWFNQQFGNSRVLQPNRYEVSDRAYPVSKVYIDGALVKNQAVDELALEEIILGQPITFGRALNPHAGTYFLNAEQMYYWAQQSYFLDRDISFIGPMESAASLGIIRTFTIYKPLLAHANFFEIQHFGTRYLDLINQIEPK